MDRPLDDGLNHHAMQAKRRIDRVLRRRCNLDAACVSVIVGCSVEEVLRAFGADPAQRPVGWTGAVDDDTAGVSVVELPGAVVAVEDGGFAGCSDTVMQAASARGRAAGIYWNDIGDQAVMFAEKGEILDGGDYLLGVESLSHPGLAAIVDELAASTDDPRLLGLLAVERFTEIRIEERGDPSPVLVHRIPD